MTLAVDDLVSEMKRQIAQGELLLEREVDGMHGLAKLREEKSAWSLRNKQLLFQRKALAGYEGTSGLPEEGSWELQLAKFRKELSRQLVHLRGALTAVAS